MGTVSRTIQHRFNTAANLASANAIYAMAEEVYESDTGKRKVGDGVTAWNALQYEDDKFLSRTNALTKKGVIDASGNPNYPAGKAGDIYVISVAGKIGGASGVAVDVADIIICVTNTAAGNQAAVGANWTVTQANLVGALLAANNLSEVNPATARTNLGIDAAIDTGIYSFLPPIGLPNIKNLQQITIRLNPASGISGDNDVYTVPVGKKLVFLNALFINQSVSGSTIYMTVKNPAYKRISSSSSVGANSAVGFSQTYILEAGEILAFNSTQASNGVTVKAFLIPSDIDLKVARADLSTSNTTIYTCPTGKTALILPNSLFNGTFNSSFFVSNFSGAARTVTNWVIPSGQSLANNYRQLIAASHGNGIVYNQPIDAMLNAGDSIVCSIDSNAANISAWVLVWER